MTSKSIRAGRSSCSYSQEHLHHCTADGELAQIESYSLNQEMIDQESRFDGFYALCTDLGDPAPAYTRTDLTNHLHGSAGFRTDTQIVTRQKMRNIIAQTK